MKKTDLKFNIQKMKIMASGPSLHEKQMGKQCQTLSFWAPKSLQMVIAAMKLKDAYFLEGKTLSFWAPKSLQMVTAAMKLKDACSLEEKL